MLLDQESPIFDDRLRKILDAQLSAGDNRAGRQQLPPLPAVAATTVHQVKVRLYGAKPPIWRRLQIPSDMRLDLLHEVLQTAFGWYDCHLHQFETAYGDFGDPAHDTGWSHLGDESAVTIAQVAEDVKAKVSYLYDFGDEWRHDIVVESIGPASPGVRYPRCTGGRGLPPVEDSGGIWAHNRSGRAASAAIDAEELTRALASLAR